MQNLVTIREHRARPHQRGGFASNFAKPLRDFGHAQVGKPKTIEPETGKVVIHVKDGRAVTPQGSKMLEDYRNGKFVTVDSRAQCRPGED